MSKFLVDANLPARMSVWQGDEFLYVNRINEAWTDTQIWEYAKLNHLTIITKDSDFSHRIIVSKPPPKVIHIRIGNLRLRDFQVIIATVWPTALKLSDSNKLVNVFENRVEAFN